MRTPWAAAVLLPVHFLAADGAPLDPDLRAAATHTAEAAAPGVVLRYDPSRVDREAAAAEAARASPALRALEEALEERLDAPALLYLYRDAADLAEQTGAPPEWGGFAARGGSLHVPFGAPLRHELTHLVARRFPGAAEDPGGLLREGLAAAMEGTDRGIPVEDWAAVERRLGLLAPLADLRARWPEGPPADAHPYHAAGAFVRWLLATRGLPVLKALYADPGRARELLGAEGDRVEEAWHAALDARAVDPGSETAVRRWFGLPEERLPSALDRARAEDLLAGESPLGRFSQRLPGTWSAGGAGLRGLGPAGAFAALDAVDEFPAGTVLRAGFVAGRGASLFLRVSRAGGASDEVLLRPDGVFLTVEGGRMGLSRAPKVRLAPGRRTTAVLETRGRDARLYLDGWLVHEVRDAFRGAGGAVGLGVSGGSVEVDALEVLLPP